jgi:hypothetical protein
VADSWCAATVSGSDSPCVVLASYHILAMNPVGWIRQAGSHPPDKLTASEAWQMSCAKLVAQDSVTQLSLEQQWAYSS